MEELKHKTKNPIVKKEFAARLKKLRNDAGLYQHEVAEKIGVSRTTYIAWESKSKPTLPKDLRHLIDLCEILDSQPLYLMCGLFNESKERRHNKTHRDIYSRSQSNADFSLIVGMLMQLDDESIKEFSSFCEYLFDRIKKGNLFS